MLRKTDLNALIDRKQAKAILGANDIKLAKLQRECKELGIPVIIVFEGLSAAGKGTQINRLIAPLDPRGFFVYATNRATEDEMRRPFLWRFWTRIPEQGRIAVFDRSWYRRVLTDRFDNTTPKAELSNAFRDIQSFEHQLTADGTVIIKLFLYISKEEQKRRFDILLSSKETKWRVTKNDLKRNEKYEEYLKINEEMLERSDFDFAAWNVIEATDKNYAAVKISETVAARLKQEVALRKGITSVKQEAKTLIRLADEESVFSVKQETNTLTPFVNEENIPYVKKDILSTYDLSKSFTKEEYKKKLNVLQAKLNILHSEIYRQQIPVILAFEGWDAAGKGGAIKRLTSTLDPRGYRVNPIASPSDIEKKHHYLWRFWNNIPKSGHIAIFDRTWYGRVMVERIEGFCSEAEWKRAYQEINEMEQHLADANAVVLKFWLHIDKDEQKARFEERMNNPEKQWKITDEDWRNREKWDLYKDAVNEMLEKTSTPYAPWIVIEGNNKYYARIKVLETVVKALKKKL